MKLFSDDFYAFIITNLKMKAILIFFHDSAHGIALLVFRNFFHVIRSIPPVDYKLPSFSICFNHISFRVTLFIKL